MITPQEAATEILARDDSKAHLLPFRKYTKPELIIGKHHEKIAEVLERVESGELKRVMILAPRRHLKSVISSQAFPAWFIGRNPNKQILCVSYGDVLAKIHGREVRDLIQSQRFKNIFPGIKLRDDSHAADRFLTDNGGVYNSAGIGGIVSGLGADCVADGSKIQTDLGLVEIKEIANNISKYKVLGYNHGNGRLVYNKVIASRKVVSSNGIQIKTKDRILKTTSDHRIFVYGHGYKEAKNLQAGYKVIATEEKKKMFQMWFKVFKNMLHEVLRSNEKYSKYGIGMLFLFKKVFKEVFRNIKEHKEKQRSLLFEKMFRVAPFNKKSKKMYCLQKSCFKKDKKVLRRLFFNSSKNGSKSKISKSDKEVMRYLPKRIFICLAKIFKWFFFILFNWMRTFSPLNENEGKRKSKIQSWIIRVKEAPSFSKFFCFYAKENIRKRWIRLCYLLKKEKTSRSSYKSYSYRKLFKKLSNALHWMSYKISSKFRGETEFECISSINRNSEETTYYDIQVEETENFFANGILVHNCLLIDDPHKNEDEALNVLFQEMVFDYYKGTLRPTLQPNGAIVIIMSRWGEGDLVSRILESGTEKWEVVRLPALAEENDPLGRAVDEPLQPEWASYEFLMNQKAVMGNFSFNAQFQQNPDKRVAGALWTMKMIDPWRVNNHPELLKIVIAIDPAVTAKADSDETGMGALGVGIDGHIYVLEDASGIFTPNQWARRAVSLYEKWGANEIVGEVNNGGDLIESNIKSVEPNLQFIQVRATKGKMRRAEPVANLYSQGKVHHVGYFRKLEGQLCTYSGIEGEDSPDRLDFLVWGCWRLLIDKQSQFRVG